MYRKIDSLVFQCIDLQDFILDLLVILFHVAPCKTLDLLVFQSTDVHRSLYLLVFRCCVSLWMAASRYRVSGRQATICRQSPLAPLFPIGRARLPPLHSTVLLLHTGYLPPFLCALNCCMYVCMWL